MAKILIDVPPELTRLCADHHVKPKEVLQGFIADLCALPGSHGSDERNLAADWYSRAGYTWMYLPQDAGGAP